MEHVSLIYTLLVLHLTINNANDVLDRLGSSDARISDVTQLVDCSAMAPETYNHRFRGVISHVRTGGFNFVVECGPDRRGFTITRLHDQLHGVEDWGDDDGKLGAPREKVSEKAAYDMARRWMEDLGFDVAEMEKTHKPRLKNSRLRLPKSKGVSSRFTVRWGGDELPRPPATASGRIQPEPGTQMVGAGVCHGYDLLPQANANAAARACPESTA